MVQLIFVSENGSGSSLFWEGGDIYVYVHKYSNMYIHEYTLYVAFSAFIQNIWIRMEYQFIPKVKS